jgi:hypothetical protein
MRARVLKKEARAEYAICDTFTDALWAPYSSHLQREESIAHPFLKAEPFETKTYFSYTLEFVG